jgi:tripeptide aminopeptidase
MTPAPRDLTGVAAINARAQRAWFDVDLRADDMDGLQKLEAQASAIISGAEPGIQAGVAELGRRPAGRAEPSDPLVRAAAAALREAGLPCEFRAASTDANAAYEAGVPAIALGVTRGEGEHTLAERIDTEPVPAGLAVLADTIDRFRKGQP